MFIYVGEIIVYIVMQFLQNVYVILKKILNVKTPIWSLKFKIHIQDVGKSLS